MRPFNATEQAEIAAWLPSLDAMESAEAKLKRHHADLIDAVRFYRRAEDGSSTWEYWGSHSAKQRRRYALQAVRTIRAYRYIAKEKGWTL